METIATLAMLSSQMAFEPAEDLNLLDPAATKSSGAAGCPGFQPAKTSDEVPSIFHAVMPGGRRISLLKTLLTSACERNCFYCPFRAGRDYRRATMKPDEMASTFANMHRAGLVEGLFLSSGIAGGGMRTQDRLIDTADILRRKYQFDGYLHLKLMPGAERDQVVRAMQLADRVSINLEAPNQSRLASLAPKKDFAGELLQPLRWVEDIRRSQPAGKAWRGRWPSTTTQFVVGAAGESDLELLQSTEYLYRQLRLARAYFSAFSPVVDTPLESLPPESPLRELRLYQASFLLRDYGFAMEELPFEDHGDLPRETDPKTAWAQHHLRNTPIEINAATREQLLRIPGIGPAGAKAILVARRKARLRSLADLRHIGVNPGRLAPFILLDGRRPVHQMALF